MREQFTEIIQSKDLKDISIDLIEKVLDNEISSEILKEVPILKSLVAARNIYQSYTDRIFINKAMNVLLELGETNWKERIELTRELDDDDESGPEKILMAIDRLETTKKCKVYGRLCSLKALRKLKYTEDFLRLTKLIQDAYLDDLILVTDFKKGERKEIHLGDYYPILSLGLIYQESTEQKPIEKNHQYNEYDPEFKGGEIEFNYLLSDLGVTLLEHFYDLFPEYKK
ncbi:hypothetical protein [Cyclobacterium qasimii]|uniref:Uncharacterized protein n=2 Tax=Cyclobacterium qasimii TaxID=1350429 RepID=S7VNS9_9BACT|nr:hypothetical protein [Cyclobacterium qasimii]EPR71037.1 hypothetical protein ADICYQ_0628 [Cyclobacterium qasimii M12-11B]GEO24037.1 hypothetical protein CQA01_45710 [Cyclobacterium qasimii]